MPSFPTRPLLTLAALGIVTFALLASLRTPASTLAIATTIQKSRADIKATPTIIARTPGQPPTPHQTATPTNRWVIDPVSDQTRGNASSQSNAPLTTSDFLRDYLTNRTYPSITDGTPWTNNTVNVAQLQEELGGVTYWDFFSEPENWDSPFYMWQNDDGIWRPYAKEIVRDSAGRAVAAYVLLDRKGPGAMDRIWFTQDAAWMLATEQSRKDVGPYKSIDEIIEWGNIDKLGNLRIEVDEQIAYDGAIIDWLSGKAFRLTPELAQVLTWRHREFGSNGNIIPVLYQKHLRVLTYGGTKKPKWFLATGVRFSDNTPVKPYTGAAGDLPIEQMMISARNVIEPENYINTLDNVRAFDTFVQAGNPAVIQLNGAGTVRALQFRIAKRDDPKQLWLRIKYNNLTAIDLPLIAFFGDQKYLTPHRSTPLGIIESNNAYTFYCNLPLPYRNGMVIELTGSKSMTVSTRLAISSDTAVTQLQVDYRPTEKLAPHTPDYRVSLSGDGKLVGIVLQTEDPKLDAIPKVQVPGKPGVEDPVKRAWAMGYLEGNLALTDGLGRTRVFGGHEDWADGGFYFNRGYTEPTGGANRPFGGILRYKDGKDGYATIFRYFNDLSAFRFKQGLTLAFGHGTWQNNFPVSYGTTLYYYRDILALSLP